MIDINNFDAIRIGLASLEADSRLVVRRGHEAGDDQLPHAEAREGRPVLRAHLRSHEGLGVLLRQVQARPLQGHHLRAVRRRGDAAEGPRASAWATSTSPRPSPTSGSSRASRAGSATCSTSRRRSSRRSSTSPRRSSPRSTTRSGPPTSPTSRTRSGPSPSGSTSTATSSSPRSSSGSRAGATTSRRARRRTSTRTTSSGRAASRLGRGAGAARRSTRLASSSAASSSTSPQTITTEDSKKIRELVRKSAIRDDRDLTPRELDLRRAGRRADPRGARAARRRGAEAASGSKKGAITKHINAASTRCSPAPSSRATTRARRRRSTAKNLEKARELGNGPAARACRDALTAESADEIRELANDLCLKAEARMQKEDLDAIIQWSLKVREMYLDIESRREDAREAAVECGPPPRGDLGAIPRARAEGDRQRRADLPRAEGPLRIDVRLRRVLRGRHGRGGDPRPAQGARPRRRGRLAPRDDPRRRRVRSSSARSSA